MPSSANTETIATKCHSCPLRLMDRFQNGTSDELDYISRFKSGELAVEKGAEVLVEGAHSAHLYTVLSGWMFRHKTMPDGRRQVLNFALPGDLIGLQGSMLGEMQHTVEALTPARLCVFEKSRLPDLYRSFPELGYDLTWIASREERMLDENLLSLGRRTALERAAYLLAFLHKRGMAVGVLNGNKHIPITQYIVSDMLGLSMVHTNKTLRKLAARNLIKWHEKACEVVDLDGLIELSGWDDGAERARPLL